MVSESLKERINHLMVYAEMLLKEASVLKEELEGSGVPDSSPVKGPISDEVRSEILKARKIKRTKKAIKRDGLSTSINQITN